MADLTLTMTITARAGTDSIAFTHTFTLTDVDDVGTERGYVGQGAGSAIDIFHIDSGAGSGYSTHGYNGPAFVMMANQSASGVTNFVGRLASAPEGAGGVMMGGLPFFFYHGSTYDGVLNTDADGLSNPTEEPSYFRMSGYNSVAKVAALAAYKPVS